MSARLARAFGNLPLRWKILLPFALLSLVYGVTGTYVFAQGTAARVRAGLAGRLRDAATAATEALQRRQTLLAGTARVVARTEGVAEAVARGDREALRRLVLPHAVNFRHGVVAVTDARGTSLLQASVAPSGEVRVDAGGDWSGEAVVRAALAAPPGELGELRAALLRRGGLPLLAVAAPLTLGPGGLVGGVVVGDRLADVVRELGRVIKARATVLDPSGRRLAGAPVAPPPRTALAVQRTQGGREVLYVPLRLGRARAGTLALSLPAPAGFEALGSEGWKIGLLALAALAGVFVAGAWVARAIAAPLGELLEASRALQAGDLRRRVGLDTRDELGELAASFDRMAEELEASHAELEQRVEERTRDLRAALKRLDRANAELARASEAKSQFLANVSHELRTPLHAILMAAELLGDPRRPLPEPELRRLGERILRQGRHLLALIEDLLDLSRIEAGRLELRPQPVVLGPLLAEVDGAVRSMAEQKGVALEVARADGHRVVADPVRLRQVLLNLLSNAVKFTQPGGRVWVEVGAARGAVEIAVRDTGIGIPRPDRRRIFEAFEQGRPGQPGAGLGLAISKRLVELHGGTLSVRSRVGKGSTFTLRLPAPQGGER